VSYIDVRLYQPAHTLEARSRSHVEVERFSFAGGRKKEVATTQSEVTAGATARKDSLTLAVRWVSCTGSEYKKSEKTTFVWIQKLRCRCGCTSDG
jgi:hypothetical protein